MLKLLYRNSSSWLGGAKDFCKEFNAKLTKMGQFGFFCFLVYNFGITVFYLLRLNNVLLCPIDRKQRTVYYIIVVNLSSWQD